MTLSDRAGAVTLSVVVPLHEGAATIERCIDGLLASAEPGDEIIVVDDGSTDGGLALVRDDRVTRIRLDRNVGRGPARNAGVERATGDVVVFVDADVAVHGDALARIRERFAADPGLTCLIGSYDECPADPGRVSQYRNLLHHFTHHVSGRRAPHFWTGLGAVRRATFVEVGGLDEVRWARNMEDVEFGHRLVDAGHVIEVAPDVEGTHLKGFTLASMVRTDLLNRAVPWSSLLLTTGFRRNDFVVSRRQTASVALVGLGVLALLVALVARSPAPLVVAGSALVGFVLLNLPLWRFLAHERGAGFAATSVPLHLVHTACSGLGFATALVAHVPHLARARRADRPTASTLP